MNDAPPKKPLTRGTIWARRLIAVLFGIVVAFLLLELLLSTDPIGLRYIRDYVKLTAGIVPAPAGYTYAAGVVTLSRSTVTMREDGTRLVPSETPDDLASPLIFVGDSVTFGLGVSDDQTFVDRIAAQLHGQHVVNAAIPAYTLTNILRVVAEQPADARIVYLITDNDADPEYVPDFTGDRAAPDVPWIALYVRFLPVVIQARDARFGNVERDLDSYRANVDTLVNDPRVLIVGYDEVLTPLVPSAVRIAPYTSRLSFADEHPSPEGHQQLADELLPLVREHLN